MKAKRAMLVVEPPWKAMDRAFGVLSRPSKKLARLVKRDFKNVHQDVQLLKEFGLIELKENGPGRASAPKANFAELILAA